MALEDKTREGLDELLAGVEERLARLERKDISRELVVNKISVFKETLKILEQLTITEQDFCTFVAGREDWGPTSTGLRVGFLQACAETWT